MQLAGHVEAMGAQVGVVRPFEQAVQTEAEVQELQLEGHSEQTKGPELELLYNPDAHESQAEPEKPGLHWELQSVEEVHELQLEGHSEQTKGPELELLYNPDAHESQAEPEKPGLHW